MRTHFLDSLVTAVLDPRSRLRAGRHPAGRLLRPAAAIPGLWRTVAPAHRVCAAALADELEQAIAGPAERVGLSLEPGLTAAYPGRCRRAAGGAAAAAICPDRTVRAAGGPHA